MSGVPARPVAGRARPLRLRGPALVATFVAVALGVAGPVLAHAALVASDPEDGQTVTEPLEEVRLEFDGPVRAERVAVVGPDGRDVADGEPAVAGEAVEQALAGLPETGDYNVAYRVASADEHRIEGELTFTYLGPVTAADDSPSLDDPADPAGLLRWWPLAAVAAAVAAVAILGARTWRRLG